MDYTITVRWNDGFVVTMAFKGFSTPLSAIRSIFNRKARRANYISEIYIHSGIWIGVPVIHKS